MKWWEIQPAHRTSAPQALVSVDTETVPRLDPENRDRRTLVFRLGVARYVRLEAGKPTRRDTLEFTTLPQFWEWLRGKLRRWRATWLWCHNAGFDLSVLKLWARIDAGDYSLHLPAGRVLDDGTVIRKPWHGMAVIQDPPTALILRHRSGAILHCCDTVNWFPKKLELLAPLVGMEQLPRPGDAAEDADWWERCRVDCEILERIAVAIGQWVRRWDAGRHRYTVAGQSLALFRHRCLPTDVPINWGHRAAVKTVERTAYYGATRQAYFRGVVCPPGLKPLLECQEGAEKHPIHEGGPVHHLDLSSAYGAVMRQNRYPVAYERRYRGETAASVARMLETDAAVALVTLDDRREPWPLRRGQEVWWCVGPMTTYLCGPELERACRSGVVSTVHCVWRYRSAVIFDAFVDACWQARVVALAEGQPVLAGLAKGIMAALHGRLSARCHRWKDVKGAWGPVDWGHYGHNPGDGTGRVVRRSLGRLVQQQQPAEESKTGFPLIGAYVASYCREHMRRLRAIAGALDVFYIDTDSIHVSPQGRARLEAAGEVAEGALGKLHQAHVYQQVEYRGPLDYIADGEVTLSGLKGGSVPVGPESYRVEEWSRLPSMLSRQPGDGVTVTDRIIPRPRHPIRGRVGSDGWVEPLDARWLPVAPPR